MISFNRPLRIAVADDDPRLRDFLKRALSWLGHQVVVVASDGEQLVDGCVSTHPDLIITDVNMPRLTGVEAVQRLWQTSQVPVILLTGLPDVDLLARQPSCVPVYLMKPVPLVDLAQAIAQVVARNIGTHGSPNAAEQASSASSR